MCSKTLVELYGNGNKDKSVLYNDVDYYHRLIESMKFAYAQRTLLGDGDYVRDAMNLAINMTTEPYTKWIAAKITNRAHDANYYGGVGVEQLNDHGTSHVSIIDQWGNAVSATSTVNRW